MWRHSLKWFYCSETHYSLFSFLSDQTGCMSGQTSLSLARHMTGLFKKIICRLARGISRCIFIYIDSIYIYNTPNDFFGLLLDKTDHEIQNLTREISHYKITKIVRVFWLVKNHGLLCRLTHSNTGSRGVLFDRISSL